MINRWSTPIIILVLAFVLAACNTTAETFTPEVTEQPWYFNITVDSEANLFYITPDGGHGNLNSEELTLFVVNDLAYTEGQPFSRYRVEAVFQDSGSASFTSRAHSRNVVIFGENRVSINIVDMETNEVFYVFTGNAADMIALGIGEVGRDPQFISYVLQVRISELLTQRLNQ